MDSQVDRRPLSDLLFTLKGRFVFASVILVLLMVCLIGHIVFNAVRTDAFIHHRYLFLVIIPVLTITFFYFLFRDILLPWWQISQQLLQAAREPDRIREFANAYMRGGRANTAQAALNELFFRFDNNLRKLRISNAEALRRLAAIEASHDGISMVTAKGVLTYANWTFFKLHARVPGTQAAGRVWLSFYDSRMQKILRETSLEILHQDGFWQGEMDDGHRVIELSLSMLEDGGFIAIERDVTRRRQIELEKDGLQKMLNQSQKMEAVGRLTGGVAHDFNNMLAVIIGNLELIEEDTGSALPVRQNLEAALRAAQRGAELTQKLLSFSRRQVLTPKIVEPGAMIADAMKLLSRVANERISIQAYIAADVSRVAVDVGQMENALLNLVINARDAMPQGGAITIAAENATIDTAQADIFEAQAGDYVRISVNDTGCGIREDVLVRIFEPFFTTKEAGHGTGLGLSMVYGFIKQSRGFVRVESAPNKGTSMQLYLPQQPHDHSDKRLVQADDALVPA